MSGSAHGELLGPRASTRAILPLEGEGWAPVAEGDWEDGVTDAESTGTTVLRRQGVAQMEFT